MDKPATTLSLSSLADDIGDAPTVTAPGCPEELLQAEPPSSIEGACLLCHKLHCPGTCPALLCRDLDAGQLTLLQRALKRTPRAEWPDQVRAFLALRNAGGLPAAPRRQPAQPLRAAVGLLLLLGLVLMTACHRAPRPIPPPDGRVEHLDAHPPGWDRLPPPGRTFEAPAPHTEAKDPPPPAPDARPPESSGGDDVLLLFGSDDRPEVSHG